MSARCWLWPLLYAQLVACNFDPKEHDAYCKDDDACDSGMCVEFLCVAPHADAGGTPPR